MVTFNIKVADIVLKINAFYENTKRYCKDFLSEEEPEYEITMSEEDLKNEVTHSNNGHVYVSEEISALYRQIAELFIYRNIVVIHGSAFKVNDYAFLVTARSGVGKSTHVRLSKELLKDKLEYINDDKPLLGFNNDTLTMYSSPWNGKERRGNNIKAPLKAIIFLNRGEDNTYRKIDNKEEIYVKLLSQIYLPLDKQKREKALKIVDILLKRLNFYEINVNMDISASKMTYERIINYETK